ncbi:hypothetical protein ACWYBU_01230, partial [Fusobacterium polymorphum]
LNNTKSIEIADRINKKLDKISNKLKDYNIIFKIPNYSQLKNLFNTGYSIYKGRWCYAANLSNGAVSYGTVDNLYNGYDDVKGLGIYELKDFFENLDNRNAKSLKNINDRNQLLKDLTTILNTGKTDKNKNLIVQESKQLKDFEVILNYNLLDTGIIIGEENTKKFKNLVEAYKNYKEYISCIYIKDGTLDTVEILFNNEKIISEIENKKGLLNKIEIVYQENN